MTYPMDIVFTVSKNSISYVNYARSAYLNLSSNTNSISFKYFCLDKVSYKRLSKEGHNAIFMGELSGSYGHSRALDAAIKSFEKNRINILSDTDVVIVADRWNEKVERELIEKKTDVLGTQLEKIGGFSSGDSIFQQYKGKPSTTWLAFAPRIDTEGLSTSPCKGTNLRIDSPELSHLYGLPIGFELVRDTGWQIPSFLQEKELSYQVLEHVKPTESKAVVLKNTSPYHDEFHLDDQPFLVHQRGSMTHLFRYDALSRDFYDAVDVYLNSPDWSIKRSWNDTLDSGPILIKRRLRVIRNFMRISRK